MKSFRPGDDTGNNPPGNAREKLDNLVKEKIKKVDFSIPSSSTDPIPSSSTNPMDKYFKDPSEIVSKIEEAVETVDKGKNKILNSPSLENLNEESKEA
jgi:hypothetical protein